MTDVKAKHFGEIPYYRGPNAIPGIQFHSAGKELGVTAWGMNVLTIDAGCGAYPEHDHLRDGQEEVYVVLEGTGFLEAGSEKTSLSPGILVRVGPAQKRKIWPGPKGIVVLALGGTPGKVHTPR